MGSALALGHEAFEQEDSDEVDDARGDRDLPVVRGPLRPGEAVEVVQPRPARIDVSVVRCQAAAGTTLTLAGYHPCVCAGACWRADGVRAGSRSAYEAAGATGWKQRTVRFSASAARTLDAASWGASAPTAWRRGGWRRCGSRTAASAGPAGPCARGPSRSRRARSRRPSSPARTPADPRTRGLRRGGI